ncbi:MAG: hypothetical protein KatS3mg111_1429 [Pirellulaceae bacterium]|nr:MAG: hypothetical protein KatS3mg111_1429 [Pirellulaceae bacterium]
MNHRLAIPYCSHWLLLVVLLSAGVVFSPVCHGGPPEQPEDSGAASVPSTPPPSAAVDRAESVETAGDAAECQPVVFTTQEDHQHLLDLLGIERLRPGRSASGDSPHAANYDEALANPFNELPELMRLQDGTSVTTAEQWWQQRRPEIIELLEREVYGRVPEDVPAVQWQVLKSERKKLGEVEVTEQRLAGVVDNSRCPEIPVTICMQLTLPAGTDRPLPVLMQFGFTWFDAQGEDLEFSGRRLGGPRGPSKAQILAELGWGCATVNAYSIQQDAGGASPRRNDSSPGSGGGLTRGIIGLCNRGQPRRPEQWGALRAWGWGASRCLDYLHTVPAVDAHRVAIDGVSRFGKAALVTMALDTRFAAVLVGSSGKGGATLLRRNFGEAVENLAGSGEYHWMAGNFVKYAAEQASFGSMTPNDLPVDAHMLIALCAPRPTFISYGVPEQGDAQWLDHRGSFMAAIAAQPAFRLLGARDLGRSDDYWTELPPPPGEGLLDGQLAWRQHHGGHTDLPNIPHFVQWVERLWDEQGAPTPPPAATAPPP